MFDMESNHKIVEFRAHATQTQGTNATSAKDMMAVSTLMRILNHN